jgi:hypothetical protein
MLAIILALEDWRAELEGLQADPFSVYSDHKALEYFITTKKLSARQARWAEYLSRFHFKLMYRIGKANERADALSKKHKDVKGGVMLRFWACSAIVTCSHALAWASIGGVERQNSSICINRNPL